eukprot:762128-Hanusia_phi.AAC.11
MDVGSLANSSRRLMSSSSEVDMLLRLPSAASMREMPDKPPLRFHVVQQFLGYECFRQGWSNSSSRFT